MPLDYQFSRKPLSPMRLALRAFVIALTLGALFFVVRFAVRRGAQMIPPVYGDTIALRTLSRGALVSRVIALQTTLASYDARLTTLAALQDENIALKAELGRAGNRGGVLANVLATPDKSLYGTFIIDAGANEGVKTGQVAYAFGGVALGNVTEVDMDASTVTLFSAAGRTTEGRVTDSDLAVTLIGRGGGEYEVRMPRDVHFVRGGTVSYQSIDVATLAVIERIDTDPRDPFQRLLAKAPVNLENLKWVILR